jgi:hypothetical protein
MAAISYPAVLAAKKTAANQWEESAFLREMERQKFIKHVALGPTIELPLDYQRNPGTAILNTDLQPTSLALTEVVTSASFTPAQVSVPMTWSKMQEAQNESEVQKIALVKTLLTNAIDSHDDILEQYLFYASTNGFLGLGTHVPTSGQGTDGGISAVTYTFWRNQANTYTDDTDIEASMTTTWNQCAKGSGSKMMPTLIVASAATQSLFEGTQQANQRWVDTEELKAGFKILGFKTARFVFSQYGDNYSSGTGYMLNSKNFNLIVSKKFFRNRGDTMEIPNGNGYTSKIYSALQTVTDNKSRLGAFYTTGS